MAFLWFRHGRACPGHPRLALLRHYKTWVPGTRPGMTERTMTKTTPGNFFEDFRLGQTIQHATPRTVTLGDVALYNALFGARFAAQSSDPFAYAIGYPQSPVDDLLVFHIVF